MVGVPYCAAVVMFREGGGGIDLTTETLGGHDGRSVGFLTGEETVDFVLFN